MPNWAFRGLCPLLPHIAPTSRTDPSPAITPQADLLRATRASGGARSGLDGGCCPPAGPARYHGRLHPDGAGTFDAGLGVQGPTRPNVANKPSSPITPPSRPASRDTCQLWRNLGPDGGCCPGGRGGPHLRHMALVAPHSPNVARRPSCPQADLLRATRGGSFRPGWPLLPAGCWCDLGPRGRVDPGSMVDWAFRGLCPLPPHTAATSLAGHHAPKPTCFARQVPAVGLVPAWTPLLRPWAAAAPGPARSNRTASWLAPHT